MKYNEIAAHWWAEKLREVDPSELRNLVGIQDPTKDAMATLIAASMQTSKESIDDFEEKLAKAIAEYIESGKPSMELKVELGLDEILYMVSLNTKVPMERFPANTVMEISQKQVTVNSNGKKEIIFKS